jgi:hypothetical protein
MSTAQRTIERARASDHAISLCYALARAACPVALWVGDIAAAECYVSMLLDHSSKLAMAVWQAEGRCFKGMLLIRRGRGDAGLRLLRALLHGSSSGRSQAPARHLREANVLRPPKLEHPV